MMTVYQVDDTSALPQHQGDIPGSLRADFIVTHTQGMY